MTSQLNSYILSTPRVWNFNILTKSFSKKKILYYEYDSNKNMVNDKEYILQIQFRDFSGPI